MPNLRRLSRRRFVSLAAATAAAMAAGRASAASAADVTVQAPYFCQGDTGPDSGFNCGPATVAAAVNYSRAASPSVADVRAAIGEVGPTNIDQWAWLLDVYGVPWYPTWSQYEIDQALRSGHAVVMAAWMADLSSGPDFEQAYSANSGQSGRYDAFAQGHALLIAGTADAGQNYLVHDPNVFPGDEISFYDDGAPKGSYRRYSSAELWGTIAGYADGLGLAVAPMLPETAAPRAVKRIHVESGELFTGPGGGHAPRRAAADGAAGGRGLTGEVVPHARRARRDHSATSGADDVSGAATAVAEATF